MSAANTGWRLLILDAPSQSLTVDERRITLELVSPGPQGASGAGGGGAVASVNGQTGAVVLGAADVGAAASVHGHAIADVTGLSSALSGKSDVGHGHAIADVSGLQTALDGKAASSHTHGVGDVTGLGTAATRDVPSSGNAGATQAVLGSDTRLSDARTPTAHASTHATAGSDPIAPSDIGAATSSHTHGNITNAGAIGSTSGVPIITGTGGVLQAGAFGSTAGTICEGSDSRLSDARIPVAHANSHNPITGSDPITPSLIGAAPDTHASQHATLGTDPISPSSIGAANASHTHGNITNAGAIGTTANLPIITTTSGVLAAGSFGTAANTFCQGNDSRLSDARTPTGTASGDLTGTYPSPTVAANAVTDTKLRDSAALSVIGRSANTTGDPADITAGTDGQVLRRSGTALGFGTVDTAGIANNAVTYQKMQNCTAHHLLGRGSGNGQIQEIVATSFAQTLLDDATSSAARTTLGVALDLPQVGPITSTITANINGSSTASQRVWHGFLGPYTGANVTVTANRVYYLPVFIPHIQAVRNLRVVSVGTVTTGNVIIGIYDSLNGAPNARQMQTSATAVSSGTAYTEIGINWTPTAPGWYWLASVYSSTPTQGQQDNGNVYIQLQGHLNIVAAGRPLHGAIETVGSHALPATAAAEISERNNLPYMAMSYTS